jgi:hypothetical protein
MAFHSLQKTPEPYFKVDGDMEIHQEAGGVIDLPTQTFITFSATSNEQGIRKTRHSGGYYFGRKFLIAAGLLAVTAIAAYVGGWFFWNIRPDFHPVDVRVPVRIMEPGPWDYQTNSYSTSFEAYDTYDLIQQMQAYWDIWTWLGNAVRFIAGLSWMLFATRMCRRLTSQARVLFSDLRAQFARVDDSIVRQVGVRGYHWDVLEASLKKQVEKRSKVQPEAKKSQKENIFQRLRAKAPSELDIKADAVVDEPVTEADVWTRFQAALREYSLIGELCDSAASRFFVNSSRLLAERGDTSGDTKAQLEAVVRQFADKETADLAPVLIDHIYEKRFASVKAEAEKLYLEQRRHDDHDKYVRGLINAADPLVA